MKLKVENISLIIAMFFRLTIVLAIGFAIYEQRWLTLFISVLILLITFLPNIFQRNYKINLPIEFEVVIVFFLYGSLYLGEIQSFYLKYWWWDIFLHALSGILLAMIGFMIIYVLNYENKINLKMSSIYVAIFTFSFAVSIGAIWEIFEYIMDTFFGFNMQKTGLDDTMHDLIVDSLGALLVSIFAYFYCKKVKVPFFDKFMKSFERENPNLFPKKK